ncbi:hypothetical protein [Bacillus sp. 03113]|uniref:hypothetical protein n=1 Tax=Bacillus sp. 03113 TaxID=2578211 RepID=UPI001141DF91|nr:hypothetical protein [Bacillus sp. 03113]
MNKFEKVLLSIFFIEIFVGGGGRLIEFGPLSIRQVLFLVLLITFAIRIIKEKALLNKEVNTFIHFTPITIGIYALMGWFFVSAVIGFVYGHPRSVIAMDFFRVSFFALYFPLAYYIGKTRFTKERIISILKYSALVVAIFTITITLLGKTVFSANFGPFYEFMNSIMTGDLFFRPSNSVFYKSHFFVLIGLIISVNALFGKKHSKLDIFNIIFGSISILWSETRGFLLAFMASMAMIILTDSKIIVTPVRGFVQKMVKLFQTKKFMKKMVILIVVIVSVPFLYRYMTLERFGNEAGVERPADNLNEENGDAEVNDVSVNARLDFILDSKRILLENPVNFIAGTGYGTAIDGRLNGIEMSMLDILVEQGLIGLSIWAFLCLMVFINYYRVVKKEQKLGTMEISLIAAFMGMLLLTNINPFINNPIGTCFFLLVLIFSQNRLLDSMKIEK